MTDHSQSPQAIAELFEAIATAIRTKHTHRPALVGVGGAQGCGKSYACRQFAAGSSLRVAHFSMDDVYLTHAERQFLARTTHPLFATRGPPGTHDLDLAKFTISQLSTAGPGDTTPLPRFDKRADDRAPEQEWPTFAGRPDLILVDGWCLGAVAPIGTPVGSINELEAEEDPHRIWRNHTIAPLATRYPSFFRQFDSIAFLQAPSFDIVRAWRAEQEEETIGRPLTLAEHSALNRFIEHFERITRAMLDGQHRAQWIVHLDERRQVISIEQRG
jgi:D-glycerate 3-kinase